MSDSPEMTAPNARNWRVLGETVRGAAHIRARQRRQDAIRWQVSEETDWSLMLAVSDGHGSATSFRSHLGANRAVRAMESEFNRLLESNPNLENLSAIKRMAEERLPQLLVRTWDEMVAAHLQRQPLTAEDLAQLALEKGSQKAEDVERNPALAYGATILGVLLTDSFLLYVQLGDGDILEVDPQGQVSRPIPDDPRLLGDRTTSLCTPNAWRDLRVRFQAFSSQPPALILLSTDGYANSFRDEASFLQVGTDLLEIIRSQGLDAVQENLPAWLSEASQAGSGDDVTLGIICRLDAFKGLPAASGKRTPA